MIIRTSVLDKAAFYVVFGASVTNIEGICPNNVFTIETKRWVAWYERAGGWIPYNQFCNQRRHLKRKTRTLAGLPEYFTGHKHTGFKLGDIATYKPWSKRELSRMTIESK